MRFGILRRQWPAMIAVLVLTGAFFLTMALNKPLNIAAESVKSSDPPKQEESGVSGQEEEIFLGAEAKEGEMRAVWVPYMSLAMSGEQDQSEAAFHKKFDKIVAVAKENGMNTLIVHVRPFADSLYPSDYFPWSHIMTGVQGVNPGYDPLEYMVKAAHKAGLQIHAWVNPLRIQTKETPTDLSHNNPYSLWLEDGDKKGWTVELENGIYFNPAYPGVRQLISDGVREIVENYEVDGVQFDDYFYPTESSLFDTGSYQAYCASVGDGAAPLELMDWRRANINALVAQVYRQIKAANPKAVFGISPQANVQNDWNMGADVASWCSVSGYIDYICPQLYVNYDHPTLPFHKGAEQWMKIAANKDIKLYFGLALYKAGSDADGGTWKKSSDILAKQVQQGRQLGCDGFMFYSWEFFDKEQTRQEVQNVVKILN